jgi:hypothetical protein
MAKTAAAAMNERKAKLNLIRLISGFMVKLFGRHAST